VKDLVKLFEVAIEKIGSSNFLLGNNDKGWKVDFDWMIANDTNMIKIIEGKYDE
jgi:hypothetical protein